LWDVESTGAKIKPLIGPETGVIPLQNGVDAAERLTLILGREAVMGGVAQISASITAPGVISQVGTFMRLIFGELDGKLSRRGEEFLALCQKAGFDATLSDQIVTELWMNFIPLTANASLSAVTRLSIGKLRDDPDIRPLFIAAFKEVIEIGRASGIALPPDVLQKIIAFTDHVPPAMKASMALDLERGNRLELALARWQGRRIGRKAQRADASPRHDVRAAKTVHHGHAELSRSWRSRGSRKWPTTDCH
jgi:2-dehydropantoate 2-reductase